MRLVTVALIPLAGVLILSCSDTGNQAAGFLSVRTTYGKYLGTDTLHFTVTNSGAMECRLASCNARLMYFVQVAKNGIWKERDSVNVGPCLALYGPIILTPGESVSEDRVLSDLKTSSAGQRRIRVQYSFSGSDGMQDSYSNTFSVGN